MGKGATAPKWTIPDYKDPTYKGFTSNTGSTDYSNGNFNYTPNAANQDFQTQLDATRSGILKSMGGTDQATNDSLNNWQQVYNNEANRLSVPALQNSMFDKGLGGSKYYMGSLNDLLAKNSNNAVLNKYQLQNQNFNQNQTAFTNVNNAESGLNTVSDNALNRQASYSNNQDNRNLDLYKTTLPYLAQYTAGQQGQGLGGLAGGLIGGIGGGIVGGPAGAVTGATAGSAIGGGIDASQGYGSVGSSVYQPTLSALSMANLPSGGTGLPFATPGSAFNNSSQFAFNSSPNGASNTAPFNSNVYNYLR